MPAANAPNAQAAVVLAPAKQAVVENGEATMDGKVQQIPEYLYAHAFVPTAGKRMTVAQVSPVAQDGKASADIATGLERLRGSAGTIEPQVSMRLTVADLTVIASRIELKATRIAN